MSGAGPVIGSLVKGAACECLDALSKDRNGMLALKRALVGIAGAKYAGLETVLGPHLLSVKFNPAQVANLVKHLKDHWFDPSSPSTFFPNTPVAETYGEGLAVTLDKSLAHDPPLPIDSNWLVDHKEFDMITFLYPDKNSPSQVNLLIATPRPVVQVVTAGNLRSTGAAWSTRAWNGRVETREIQLPAP
jgi:hypothetical protein